MSDDLIRLRDKLCRELVQAEHAAGLHTAREANQLGTIPPASALRAIGAHAQELRPSLERVIGRPDRTVPRAVAETFSALRHFFFDRWIDAERAFRGTLLGLRHAMDVVRLLREVALRIGEVELLRWCDAYMVERGGLLERAEQAMAWFAEHPARALRSGLVMALEPREA